MNHKTPLTADENAILGVILATWSYIAEEYGRTTIVDEIGAALDRAYMHADKLTEAQRAQLNALNITQTRALLKRTGRNRL